MAEDEFQDASVAFNDKRPARGLLSDEEKRRFCWFKQLACCFGTLCVILVLARFGVSVFLHKSKLNQLEKTNQELNDKNQNLINQTQNLEGETRILKEQLDNMMKTQIELNVSQAQWSIDQYCRKEKGRKCEPCQKGWDPFSSSCYAYNDEPRATQRTWEEAQQDCKGKVSHLVVVHSQEEKNYVNTISPAGTEIKGYWIGLKAEGTKWKWTDGTELADQS
ncbi:C-type lectin domain family 12 member B-like isoform X2 [Poeciliopsis prolifica]|uniref:C-type lectin domain family 12 member B-like isoform X2 n=1 Tax=Poeciliopsis prolifica TaxID=188132 RepID=UPI0024137AF1|nr:C-type lectin domain family 12 member B-like isoform X2 [Poeciliopsis prolifica]